MSDSLNHSFKLFVQNGWIILREHYAKNIVYEPSAYTTTSYTLPYRNIWCKKKNQARLVSYKLASSS